MTRHRPRVEGKEQGGGEEGGTTVSILIGVAVSVTGWCSLVCSMGLGETPGQRSVCPTPKARKRDREAEDQRHAVKF